LFAHAEVWRVDTLFYIGLVAVAGALLAAPHQVGLWRLAGIWLVPTLGWVASLYGGDFFDRDLDAIAKPQRPIPSGRMSPCTALAGMSSAIVAGTAIAVALTPLNIALVVIAGVLGVTYSKVLKARGILGNLARGGPTALALLIGATSVGAKVPPLLLVAALVFWLHDSSSNLVGALCDTEGDTMGGYRTFPVRHGDVATVRAVIAFDLAWIVLAIGLPWWPPGLDAARYEALLLPMLLLAASSIRILLPAPRPIARLDALRAHERIVIDRLFLPIALIAGHRELGVALALLAVALFATLIGQAMMRPRYEPNRLRVPAWPEARTPWPENTDARAPRTFLPESRA
jgi:4-hydroxybenzoate polyprenyltransferase/geranylgeranylglycerol-phosphate geranylgeranyltransferase